MPLDDAAPLAAGGEGKDDYPDDEGRVEARLVVCGMPALWMRPACWGAVSRPASGLLMRLLCVRVGCRTWLGRGRGQLVQRGRGQLVLDLVRLAVPSVDAAPADRQRASDGRREMAERYQRRVRREMRTTAALAALQSSPLFRVGGWSSLCTARDARCWRGCGVRGVEQETASS